MNIKYTLIFLGVLLSITSCKEVDPNKQVDEGSFKNDTYTSIEMGWTMDIPKDWDITTREQNEEDMELGLEIVEEVIDGEIDISASKDLLGFQKNDFNSFQAISEPFEIEYPGEWEEANADLKKIIYIGISNQGIKLDSTITTTVKVDGLDFLKYGFTVYGPEGDVILNQIMYSRYINGSDFGVSINYNNEKDKKDMLDAWLNSKFKKE